MWKKKTLLQNEKHLVLTINFSLYNVILISFSYSGVAANTLSYITMF